MPERMEIGESSGLKSLNIVDIKFPVSPEFLFKKLTVISVKIKRGLVTYPQNS